MDDMKKCPKCGQMVKSVAKKCRYCGYWFEEGAASPQPSVAPQPQQRVISIGEVLTEGVTLGIANFVAIFGAIILWLITIWIPYLNVGTTIAIKTMPIALADNAKPAGPTYIFDGKYRKYMGEYFTLIGLKQLSLIPAYLFLIIPGLIISLGWSMALYLVFDKHISPGEAVYNIGFFVIFGIMYWILGLINVGFITFVVMLLLIAVYMVGNVGCMAVLYRKLCK